jgi:hypothetical protein
VVAVRPVRIRFLDWPFWLLIVNVSKRRGDTSIVADHVCAVWRVHSLGGESMLDI